MFHSIQTGSEWLKFHGDPTFRWKVISEKQCYAALKYIVVEENQIQLKSLFRERPHIIYHVVVVYAIP